MNNLAASSTLSGQIYLRGWYFLRDNLSAQGELAIFHGDDRYPFLRYVRITVGD